MKTITVNIKEFRDKFNSEYGFLYDHRDRVAGFEAAVTAFDELLKTRQGSSFIGQFSQYRGDPVSSDREAAAFMFALDSMT